MAMNSPNYGFPRPSAFGASASFSAPFSSTPSDIRTQRPRFAYSGPPSYPRPRSSASKPNPNSYLPASDSHSSYGDNTCQNSYQNSEFNSMANHYGDSSLQADSTGGNLGYGGSENGTFRDSSQNSSAYFSCNDSFYPSPADRPYPASLDAKAQSLFSPQYPQVGLKKNAENFKQNNRGGFRGRFQKNSTKFNPNSANQGQWKKNMANKGAFQGSQWRCDLCNINFSSQVSLDMHVRGAKHTRKMKTQDALNDGSLKDPHISVVNSDGKTFRCDLCNIITNSSLQLQMHLDGSKHKNNVLAFEEENEKKKPEPEPETKPDLKRKRNGSALASDMGEDQPTKIAKFSCTLCNVIVNSNAQLLQHLGSKKHQAMVEGKPLNKGKKNKFSQDNTIATNQMSPVDSSEIAGEVASNPQNPTVLGVEHVSTFVQGASME